MRKIKYKLIIAACAALSAELFGPALMDMGQPSAPVSIAQPGSAQAGVAVNVADAQSASAAPQR